MTRAERICGWILLPTHMFLLPILISFASNSIFPMMGISLSTAWINVLYYAISFTLTLCLMFRYLKLSFGNLWDGVLRALQAIIFGYFLYYALIYLISILVSLIPEIPTNPNDALIVDTAKLNPGAMTVVAVLLAPVVEETLFRGVVFGTIRGKSRFLAYFVSTLIFSIYHLWQYAAMDFSWTLLLQLAQYIPGSIALAFCYEKGGSIWSSIFLHMFINYITLTIRVG